MSKLLIASWMFLAADIVLFNILYFCVVLLRVNDAGGKVSSDAFFNLGPFKYVPEYLRLLSPLESSRWYNVFIRHSLAATLVLFVAFLVILALS